jgi:acetylglutamate kinase
MSQANGRSSSAKSFVFGIGFLFSGIAGLGAGLYYDHLTAIYIGLALVALGATVFSIVSVRNSQAQMRAMANLVLHEKIAIIQSYLGKQQEQIEHDRQAAGEFERWADPSLREEFEELWQKFFERGTKPVVIKIGGSTLGSKDTTLRDVVTLHRRGFLPVIVHGGGTEITEWLGKMGMPAKFVRGQRVTDEDTLRVVVGVLAGVVNKELVAAINALHGKAIGLSGVDGGLIQAKIESPGMGYVGEVVRINPESIAAVLAAGYVPVIAPGGFRLPGDDNDPVMLLNINGDVSASEIAVALKAEKLIFLTDVAGVQDSQGNTLPRLSPKEARALVDSGVITGGMIPKVEGCLRALSAVASTQIVDGRSEDALLAAIEGRGIGTIIELGGDHELVQA